MSTFPQGPRARTVLGAILGLLFVPLMLGITACLETPIGDPEKGWVDPRVTGMWVTATPDQGGFGDVSVWTLEPYDARTWLVTVAEARSNAPDPASDLDTDPAPTEAGNDGGAPTEETVNEDDAELPPPLLTPEQVNEVVATLEAERLKFNELLVFKGWLTSIGKSRYLVLEPKHVLSSERGFTPDLWFAFRLVLRDGAMELSLVDLPSSATTRGEAEPMIAARADDPDLVEPYAIMVPVPKEHYDDMAGVMTATTTAFAD